jgi:hypothetical protein
MIGATSRTLGARPGVDIGVFNSGNVVSTVQGMSVSPMPPENLPLWRRPPEFDGTGKDPVFAMDTDNLAFGGTKKNRRPQTILPEKRASTRSASPPLCLLLGSYYRYPAAPKALQGILVALEKLLAQALAREPSVLGRR